jgi:hypothetical protein
VSALVVASKESLIPANDSLITYPTCPDPPLRESDFKPLILLLLGDRAAPTGWKRAISLLFSLIAGNSEVETGST